MADYGFKVSETGYDVKTATDVQLIFKTDSTLLKTVLSGTTNLTTEWTEITHSLNYVPQFLVFINDSSDGKTYFAAAYYGQGMARADTTKLYIRRNNVTNDTAYYYIFYEAS